MNKTLKYLTVKQSIMAQIQDGALKPGDKLPSEEEYIQTFQVSAITIRKALTELAAEGHVTRIRKKGTFVSDAGSIEDSSHLIAIILSAEDNYDISYMQIIKGAQSMAAGQNYSVIVEWCSNNPASEEKAVMRMLDRHVDGFIIYPFALTGCDGIYQLLEEKDIPYVLVDRYHAEHPCYYSGSDNYAGGIIATKELLRLNHTKIKFAAYQFFLQSEQERFDGFCCAMRQAGLYVNQDSLLNQFNYDSLKAQIQNHEITAIFCCNDKLAIKLMGRLAEYSIRVPQDVSIIGYDDWNNSRNKILGLTTVKQNFDEIGANAAHLLINVMKKQLTGRNIKILCTGTLISRSSACRNPYS